MSRSSLQILLALVVVLAAGYYWQPGGNPDADTAVVKRHMALAKTYLHGTRSWAYDDTGSLMEVMEAKRAEYFARRDVSELQEPRYYSHDGNDRTWSASASRGRIRHKPNLMLLRQNVVLRNDQTGGTLQTRAMTLNMTRHTATSRVPVTVVQEDSRMQADGMFADLNREVIEMGPNVETLYVQPR